MQHACLTRYFTGSARVRVGSRVRGTSSRTAFGRVSLGSSGPVLLSIIPSAERSALIPSWPISDSVGAPDSSAHQPNLYACKMYISAVSKQGHSHF